MDEIMFSSKPENLFERTEPLDAATMPMYVLTNASKVNGSGILARDGVLDKIGELVGKNSPYFLPTVPGALFPVSGQGFLPPGHNTVLYRRVSWCVGHLLELAQPEAYGEQYARWRYGDLPILPDEWKYEVSFACIFPLSGTISSSCMDEGRT